MEDGLTLCRDKAPHLRQVAPLTCRPVYKELHLQDAPVGSYAGDLGPAGWHTPP